MIGWEIKQVDLLTNHNYTIPLLPDTTFQLDYIPVLISDCSASFSKKFHEYSLEVIKHSFGFTICKKDSRNMALKIFL